MKERIERLKHLKNERGLTLVELLAVIVILAIVAIIAFVLIGNVIENSRADAHISNAQQLISAAKLYDAQGGEFNNNQVTHAELKSDGLIGDLIDPWGEDGNYGNGAYVTKTVSSGEVSYTVTLHAPNGKDDYDIEDATEAELAGGRDTLFP